MKYYIFLICLNLLYLNPEYKRDLKLTKNPIYYKELAQAANETFYQLFDLTIKFKNRTEVIIEDESKLLAIIIDENDPIMPEKYDISFDVTEGKPLISDILDLIPDEIMQKNFYLNAFGLKLDIKEQFKIMANMIASGFEDGKVIIYKKVFTDENFQIRYKCFIKDKESDKYIGAFEIIQQDKDKGDCKKILESIKDWWKLINSFVKEQEETVQAIANIVASIEGIYKIWKSSSVFLKNSYIMLVLLLFI